MPSLEHFQSQVGRALHDATQACPDAVSGEDAIKRERRFDIYRNNRAVSLIENVQTLYPAVEQLVGNAFFTAVARAYIDAHPPEGPVMAEFGGAFGAFMAAIPGAKNIPYIADVAQLEWCRNTAYHAADNAVLSLADLSALPPESLADITLMPHPALHSIVSRWPIGSIWASTVSRDADSPTVDMQRGEHVIVSRPSWDVQVHVLSAQTGAFLDALIEGDTVGNAAECQLDQDPDFDPGAHLSHILSLGAFTDYELTQPVKTLYTQQAST